MGEDSEGDAEEWDRHEAFHDDVDSQVMSIGNQCCSKRRKIEFIQY